MKRYTYEPIDVSFTSAAFVRAYLGQELEAAEAMLRAAWESDKEDGRRQGLGRGELGAIDRRYRGILERLGDPEGLLRRRMKACREKME
jgi:hypothetical protein